MTGGRQGLPIDDHPFRGVFGQMTAFGDNHGDGLADETDLGRRQRLLGHGVGDLRMRHLQQDALSPHLGRQVAGR